MGTDETVETTETVGDVALGAQGEAAEAKAAEPEPMVEPHPLEPGGVRFNEVYKRMKEAEERESQTRERLARVEGQLAATPQTPPPGIAPQQAPRFYTGQELQGLVDAGRISPALMSEQLAWQAKEVGKRELRQELTVETRKSSASQEVNQYLDKLPSLANQSSVEFSKVWRAAQDIAEEMNIPVTDPRVQRRALRETFGTLEKIVTVTKAKDESRHATGLPELGQPGGGATKPAAGDPLKGVPVRYLEFWKSKGYTKERMAEEAKYLTPKQRQG